MIRPGKMEFKAMNKKYCEMLEEAAKNKAPKVLMRKKWVDMMIQRITSAKEILISEGASKLPTFAKEALDEYEVQHTSLAQSLVLKTKGGAKKVIVPLESSYQIVQKAHLYTGHGNCAQMNVWLDNSNYVVSMICAPVLCGICTKCLLDTPNGSDPYLNLSYTYSTIASVSIIDMTLQPDKSFRYVLVYQDLKTKYVQLRAMTGKHIVEEICMELVKMFCDFSPPQCIVVQIDLQNVFEAVLERLAGMFDPDVKLETSNVDRNSPNIEIEKHIIKWMKHHSCNNWAIGCHIVQWEINNTRVSTETPFEKFFGLKPGPILDIEVNTAQPQSIADDIPDTVETNLLNKPEEIEPQAFEHRVENVKKVAEPKVENINKPTIVIGEPEFIVVKSELDNNEEEEEQNTDTYVCCTCNTPMKTRVYFCCVCNKSLHLYCGARRQAANNVVESICFLCLNP